MQADDGVTGGMLSRVRVALGCAALIMAFIAWGHAAAASANGVPAKETYLALGDSLGYGYSVQVRNETEYLGGPATAFEHGYVNDFFGFMHPKTAGVQLINDACAGETSASMIGDGPLAAALEASLHAHGEVPCPGLDAVQLHHPYGYGQSQLETALEMIENNEEFGTPVTTVSLDIGSFDVVLVLRTCEAEARAAVEHGEIAPSEAKIHALLCFKAHFESTLHQVAANVAAIMYALRNGAEFGYTDYTGKVIVLGYYNPYGKLFKTQQEAEMYPVQFGDTSGPLLPGGAELGKVFNGTEESVTAAQGACFVNPLPYFNPGGEREPIRMQSLLNMLNTNVSNGKADGPDFHPTPKGYRVLAKLMRTACGL